MKINKKYRYILLEKSTAFLNNFYDKLKMLFLDYLQNIKMVLFNKGRFNAIEASYLIGSGRNSSNYLVVFRFLYNEFTLHIIFFAPSGE